VETAHDELTDDAVAGPYRVLQRRRGHRYSLDDTVTAWVAARARPGAGTVLDLGTGLGSVLLMLAYKLPRARLWGIEAQPESHALLARNCARNGLLGADGRADGRARIELGDFREPGLVERVRSEAGGDGVELVTGTPPYQPLGRGTLSPDSQRAHARVELRGGVEAYLTAGARALAPGGALVVCADARTPERVLRAAPGCGLRAVSRLDVVPAAGKGALFSVFTLVHAGSGSDRCEQAPDFVARDAHGRRTEEALALRRFFGLPAAEHDAPSRRLRPRSQGAPS
jgi:tRNA1(Val) A37 N6-methylase TrmN6